MAALVKTKMPVWIYSAVLQLEAKLFGEESCGAIDPGIERDFDPEKVRQSFFRGGTAVFR